MPPCYIADVWICGIKRHSVSRTFRHHLTYTKKETKNTSELQDILNLAKNWDCETTLWKPNKTKQNKTKQNKTKQNKTKQNKTKQTNKMRLQDTHNCLKNLRLQMLHLSKSTKILQDSRICKQPFTNPFLHCSHTLQAGETVTHGIGIETNQRHYTYQRSQIH